MPFPDEQAVVTLVDYQTRWVTHFEQLSAQLSDALGEIAIAIDHIGSTSVPGMPAKDCVDVQVRVSALDTERDITLLSAIGFRWRTEEWNLHEVSHGTRCNKLVFAPPTGARPSNIHLRNATDPNVHYALLFRDYLRADKHARTAWGAFKVRLAQSAPDLLDYGQIKVPATEILMASAEQWALRTNWQAR